MHTSNKMYTVATYIRRHKKQLLMGGQTRTGGNVCSGSLKWGFGGAETVGVLIF